MYEAGSIFADQNWGMLLRSLTATPNNADFLFVNSAGTERMRIDTAGMDVTGAIHINASSAPTWDTGNRLWTESGWGSRYDGYQHRWDVGLSRTEAMRIDAFGKLTKSINTHCLST